MSIISKKRKPEITTLSNSLQRNQHTTTKHNQTQRKKKKKTQIKKYKLKNQKISKTNITFKRERIRTAKRIGAVRKRENRNPPSIGS